MENIGYNGKIHALPPALFKTVSNQEMSYFLNFKCSIDLTIFLSSY